MQQLDPRGPRTTDSASDAAFDSFDEEAQQPDIQPVVDPEAPHDEQGHVPIPTGYANTTGHQLGVFVGLLATVLVIGFFTVQHLKNGEAASLRDAADLRVHEAPPVEIAIVGEAPATQTLVLPGETRGWYSSTIYARVTGYVAKWLVDIGDTVMKDQVMAVIDTPELDAQLQAARAQLQVSEAEAAVKESDADLAKTTYVRWQTSPKGPFPSRSAKTRKRNTKAALPSSMPRAPASIWIAPTWTDSPF